MNDLEICKRIAEIENYKGWEKMSTRGIAGVFNPLTDDALCFQLLKKYNVDIISPYLPNNETKYEACIFINNFSDASSEHDDNANKAICLAIIEAHKDK